MRKELHKRTATKVSTDVSLCVLLKPLKVGQRMGSCKLNSYQSAKGLGNICVLSAQNGERNLGHSVDTSEGSHLGRRAKLAQSKDYLKLLLIKIQNKPQKNQVDPCNLTACMLVHFQVQILIIYISTSLHKMLELQKITTRCKIRKKKEKV